MLAPYVSANSWYVDAWERGHGKSVAELSVKGISYRYVKDMISILRVPIPAIVFAGARAPWLGPDCDRREAMMFIQEAAEAVQSETSAPVIRFLAWEHHVADARLENAVIRPFHSFPYVTVSGVWDDYWSGRSRKVRKNLRRARQALEGHGEIDIRRLVDVDIRDVVDRYARFTVETNRRVGRQSKYEEQREVAFLRELWRAAREAGALVVHELRLDKEVIALHVGFEVEGTFYYFFPAYGQQWREFSPGLLLLQSILEECFAEEGIERVDLGAGASQYKRWFATGELKTRYVDVCSSSSIQITLNLFHRLERRYEQHRDLG